MTTTSAALVDDLVCAHHILYVEGVVDGFGRVSVRHDQRDDRFLLACGVAPATVAADDIVEIDYDGTVHDAGGRWRTPLVHRAFHPQRNLQISARCDGHREQSLARDHSVWHHARDA